MDVAGEDNEESDLDIRQNDGVGWRRRFGSAGSPPLRVFKEFIILKVSCLVEISNFQTYSMVTDGWRCSQRSVIIVILKQPNPKTLDKFSFETETIVKGRRPALHYQLPRRLSI